MPLIGNIFRFTPVCALLAAATASAVPAPSVAKVAEPRPAIWLLADHDTRIYLFGTIHILPPGFKWRSAALDRVVKESGALVVETYLPPDEEPGAEEMKLFMAPAPSPILARVPADKRTALQAAITAGPLPIEAYSLLQTWAAAIVIGLSQLLGDYGVDDPDQAPGVEDVLEEEFRKAGKPIGSVEDALTVLRGMSDLPAAEQTQLLIEAADEAAQGTDTTDQSDAAWAAGRADELLSTEIEALPPALYEVLIRKRNAAWTEWLAKRLEQPGATLFAVGAGHLAGKDSVQAMLAKRGLVVRRYD